MADNMLRDVVRLAYRIAGQVFEDLLLDGAMTFDLVVDMESGDKWLALEFAVEGSSEEVQAAYDKYISLWIDEAPRDKRLMVSLNYYYGS